MGPAVYQGESLKLSQNLSGVFGAGVGSQGRGGSCTSLDRYLVAGPVH